ncbi:VWA domain-containing protein [Streptomyces sp. NPDC087850]|uniref:VWA domain-containing protein n=1 Tax=Streptomyces sp. NPDC087850 TaxID=3365809 RepID=UPI0037F32062
MGIRSLMRKVFGRDRAEERNESTAESAADSASASVPSQADRTESAVAEPTVKAEESAPAGETVRAEETASVSATVPASSSTSSSASSSTSSVTEAAAADLVAAAFDKARSLPSQATRARTATEETATPTVPAQKTAEAEVKPEPEAKPEPEVEAKPEAKPEPEAQAKAQPELEPEAKPELEAEPEVAPAATPVAEKAVVEAVAEAVEAVEAPVVAEVAEVKEPEVAPEPTPEPVAVAVAVAAIAPVAVEPEAEAVPEAVAPAPEPEAIAPEPAVAGSASRPAFSLARVKSRAPGLADHYKAAGAALKKLGLTGQRARVYLVVDRSLSMKGFYGDGSVQHLGERVLALAAHLDESGTVPVVLFSTDIDGSTELGLGLGEYEGAIDELHGSLGRMGRTNYHRAVEEIVSLHEKSEDAGPALVIFQTDGAPSAVRLAEQAFAEAARLPLFWQFVAFGQEEAKDFNFARKLGGDEATANVGFSHAGPVPRALPDADFYRELLAAWQPAAQAS